MRYEYLYLVCVGILVLFLIYFTIEAFHGFKLPKRNFLFLAVNTIILSFLINEYRKVFFGGIGVWGISPEAKNQGILNMLPSLTTFLFLSIVFIGITLIIVGFRTIQLMYK
jgi:hypothetical protein